MKLVEIKHRVFSCSDCPYNSREQGGVMYCSHPLVTDSGYILDRDNVLTFPKKCPLD